MALPALPPVSLGDLDEVAERGAVPAPASRAGQGGVTFLSSASDGVASGRLPSGWETEGVCWTPFCCTPVNHFPIDCSDCGAGDLGDNPHAGTSACRKDTALPFLIEVDEFQNACTQGDMTVYARENLRMWTPIVVAGYAHSQMRSAAVDVSGGVALCASKVAGLLFERRLLPGSLWVPDEAVPFFAESSGLDLVGGRAVDSYGRRAFIGPGLPNVGPDGAPAPSGTAWVYISSPSVDYGLTDIEVTERRVVGGNAVTPHAQRVGIVRVDSCDVFAALLSLDCGVCEPEVG